MLPAEIATWATRAVGLRARLVTATLMYRWRPGAPWLLRIDNGGEPTEAVLRLANAGRVRHEGFAAEAAALVFAEDHKLAAPRLIAADVDGATAGNPAVLETLLAGSSTIPKTPSPERLRAFGAAAAALHAISSSPQRDLPLRTRPIPHDDFAAERRQAVRYGAASKAEQLTMLDQLCAAAGWDHDHARKILSAPTGGPSALLDAAEERLNQVPMPEAETVFVHGDLWHGNTMWTGDSFVGMIDWDSAGAGHCGVDLGSMRLDAALMFGIPAAAEVLAGWQRATGRQPDGTAYWDVVASLNTPADMVKPLRNLHAQGRTDLDAATLAARRDVFLQLALAALA